MYDVAVIGGGISGCMAAIAAARCGASVILIEKYGFLGGTLTACGTGPMMTFHAGDVQVVRGVTNELIERLMNKGFSPGHIFDTTGYTYTVTPFSAEGMKLELEDMMAEADVELLYHSVVCDVEYENAVINSVEVYGKNGKRCIESRMFVDASGDCDLAFLAGLETNKGREADGKCQPMTMNFKVINVDTDRVKEYIMNNNDEFPRLKSDLSKVTRAPKLSIDKRTFQAIRIELNKELDVLRDSLDGMIDLLDDGGRLCIITFHSLEDRIVKTIFRKNENPCTCPPDFPVCVCGKKSKGRVITRKPILPSDEEMEENPRSKSAKLRIFEKKV